MTVKPPMDSAISLDINVLVRELLGEGETFNVYQTKIVDPDNLCRVPFEQISGLRAMRSASNYIRQSPH